MRSGDLPSDLGPGPGSVPVEIRSLGGFALREQVGAGGFADVYLADQIALGREAIVKILRPEGDATTRIQRFMREVQLASHFDHPYAAHIYAFGAEPDGVFWIAMERVRGASLRAMLEAQGPMPLERFVPLLERICEVVHTAHEQGIVHRDLKPDNVMVISRAGRLLPKLLDFGIARAIGDAAEVPPSLDADPVDAAAPTTTRSGAVLGSPSYMAPELWVDPHSAGPAADQYALGALAYEALTGQLAFTGRTVMEIARAHARTKPRLGDGLPAELERVIHRALAGRAADRFGNVLELAQAFRAASGTGAAAVDLPQLDDELRGRFAASAPRPLADAVAAYDAARNAHQAREAIRGLVRIAAWYVGLLALACRTRVGSGGDGDSDHAQMLLRDLRRQGLSPAGWIALARELTRPFARLPDTYPLPELVLLLQPSVGTDPFAPALTGSLAESLADSSEEAATQAIARELPVVATLLRALGFLLDYEVVVPRGGHGESWMGLRAGVRRIVPLRRTVAEGRPVIVDATGAPLLALWPLIQIQNAVPGHTEEMFLLAGPGRAGARLVSTLHGFEHRDDELWEWFREQVFREDDPQRQLPIEASPYRGLSSYTQSESQWFVGRERESEVVVNRLRLEPFIAIVGPSGVGKSSFVQAGVVPALPGWRVVMMRPGPAPVSRLAVQLAHAGVDLPELAAVASEDLDAVTRRLRARAEELGGVLILVDQFEELFTLARDPAERSRFARLLVAATRAGGGAVKVVITLRDDFLIRAEQLPGMDDALARGLQLLGPLGAPALERILIEPARRAGYEFEDPALPAEMVGAVIDTPAAVALISFTAARLWELRDRHFHQLPRRAYDAIGGVGGALAGHADETVDAMPAAERALVRTAFRHLVTYEGTRAVLARKDLIELLGGPDAERVIERLLDARLVTTSEDERGDGVIEIVHEMLLGAWPRLTEWRREDVEGSRFHEQLRAAAKQWQDRGRTRGLLWRGDALAEYQLWRRRHADPLAPIEAAFAAASVSDAVRGTRIRRGLIAVAIVATAVFVVSLWRADRAEQASRRAAEDLLRDSTFDRGRLMMLQGDKLGALEHLAAAYRMGDTGPAVRMLIEEALRTTRARVATLDGHTGKLWAVEYSPDGRKIATASADGTVRIWDPATGATLGVVTLAGPAMTIAFSPDGTLIACGGRDQVLHVWNLDQDKQVAALELGTRALMVQFSPDGSELVVAGLGGVLKVWRNPGFALAAELTGHDDNVGARFSGDGSTLASWDIDGRVVVWDARTLTERTHFVRGRGIVAGAVDRTGSVVAIGLDSGELDLLRADGTVVARRGAHDQRIFDLAFSPDGTVVASAGNDDTARLWDAASGDPRGLLTGHRAGVMSIRYSPAGDQMVTTSADGTARLWASSGMPLGELTGHTNLVSAAAFRPDGARVVTGGWDHRVIVWDVAKAMQFDSLPTARMNPTIPTVDVVYSPDSTRLALIAPDGGLVITTPDTGQVACRAGSEQPIAAAAWSPDGAMVATVTGGPDVDVWDAATCARIHRLVYPGNIDAVAFGPSGALATGDEDGTLTVWNVATQTADATFRDYPGGISTVGFAPDGSAVFAVTFEATAAVVWQELAPGGVRRVMTAGPVQLSMVELDARRHQIVASGLDQEVWTWDRDTGALVDKLDGTGPLWAVRTSPDGALTIGVGGTTPVVWDTATRAPVGTLVGHASLVRAGDFIGDRLFVTASFDGTARVWDLTTFRPLLVFRSVQGVVVGADRRSVVFSDVGRTRRWTPSTPAPDAAALATPRAP